VALEFSDALRSRMAGNLTTFERLVGDPEGLRHAGVAVTIVGDAGRDACFLITRRTAKLRKHAAQWALPGGRLEAGESPEHGALRELREELGLSIEPDHVLGVLDDYPTRSGYLITPIVVWGHADPALTMDPVEVESAHLVPIAELDRPEVPRFIPGADPERPVIQLPLFGRYVHAPTAAILYQFREVAMHGRETRVAHFDQPKFAWR
jgi:8-oxo-dGTP pyrophosphatase MutT (NUDIX family)